MAKNNDLFGVFLCLIAGLCIGIGSIVVESFQPSAISFQPVEVLDESIYKIIGSEHEVFINEEIDLRSLRWPCALGSSSVSITSSLAPLTGTSVFLTNTSVITDGKSDGMSSWIPGRLGNQVNKHLIRNKIKQIYTAEIGIREKTGKNDGQRVEEYLAVTNLGKGYAWCSAFVSWVFSEAGFPEPRTPWSPSLFPKKRVIWERGRESVGSDVLANRVESLNNKLMLLSNTHNLVPNTQKLIPLKPATADVFGIYFTNLKRIAHVGFVDEWGDKQVITVEGNTNEAGSAEGDGVYRKRRPIASIYRVAKWIDQEVKL